VECRGRLSAEQSGKWRSASNQRPAGPCLREVLVSMMICELICRELGKFEESGVLPVDGSFSLMIMIS
jgi:hypothetical protein